MHIPYIKYFLSQILNDMALLDGWNCRVEEAVGVGYVTGHD